MTDSFQCVDTTDTGTAVPAEPDFYTPENCNLCRNQEHWHPEMKYCVECQTGFFLTRNMECVPMMSNDTDTTTTWCTDAAMPFMVEHSTMCVD